jgi:hypothetical protein
MYVCIIHHLVILFITIKIKVMNNLIELLGEEMYVEFVLELLEEKDKCYGGEGKCYEDIEEDMLVFGEI